MNNIIKNEFKEKFFQKENLEKFKLSFKEIQEVKEKKELECNLSNKE